MIGTKKRVYYRIYGPTGVALNYHWDDAVFSSFTKSINGGFGECVITLPRLFDDFGDNEDVRLNNRVDIYIQDKDCPAASLGKIIYSGYISRYNPFIKNGKQGVMVYLLGHHTHFTRDIYKNGTTTTITETTTDLGTIMRNIMARYIAENTNPAIIVDNSRINLVSADASYEFKELTYYNAIDAVQRMSPSGWYWFIDRDNFFNFRSKASSTIHRLYYEKHFHEIESNKNIENLVNEVLAYNGKTGGSEIYKKYSDPISQGWYGRRVYTITDSNFADETTMDNYAQSILDDLSLPIIELSLTLIDNNENDFGYDIESIEVGDRVIIEGFNESIFNEDMIITEFTYSLNKMILTIKPNKNDIFNKVFSNEKKLDQVANVSIPADYTT